MGNEQMLTTVPEVRVTDNKARLTLPKGFANSTVLVEVVSDVEIIVRKAKVVPLSEDEELPPLPHVQPLSDADRDLFLAVLDNPPPPNAALRKLMSKKQAKPAT
ncbi:type II toxin-antitoxin system TacA family antitoxin [Frigoriglobus tundricola]|uniref:Uncharacterized protein n=1 Tax=Frigoriglobus tundricola TaxID=2774151 RepID=A0A6M5YRX6_9BACT|nr:DUF1778 domain-containing protein [Frigoriglobus tundricola]QJW96837.1 hypothetical protein FTUN_4397 [Frigoriglobus tundricola]